MKIAATYAALVLVVLSGCQGEPSQDPLGKESLRLMNAMADEWEKLADGSDPATFQKGQDKIGELGKELATVNEKIQKLPSVSKTALESKYKKDLVQVQERLTKAQARLIMP